MNFEKLENSAIHAELETGKKEETTEKAKAHITIRLIRMTLGMSVVILGIILMPLPGPGGLIVAAGLAILAKDVAWADRLLKWMRKKNPGIPEDGKIPMSTIITTLMLLTAGALTFYWLKTNYNLPALL